MGIFPNGRPYRAWFDLGVLCILEKRRHGPANADGMMMMIMIVLASKKSDMLIPQYLKV